MARLIKFEAKLHQFGTLIILPELPLATFSLETAAEPQVPFDRVDTPAWSA